MPLREDVLQPIAGDDPSGPNLYYTPLFDKIKEARRQEMAGPLGAWEHEVKTADYVQVAKLAEEALATKTKDLWLAAWFTEALIANERFAGLQAGLELIRGLVENFWDTLHPDLEDGDAELRAAPLEWLGNYLEPDKGSSPALAVRFVPLNTRGLQYFQYQESQKIGNEESVKGNEERRKARDAAIKEGKVPPEAFDAALTETPKAWIRETEAALKGSLASLQALDELCQAKFGNAAPSFTKLKRALEDVDGVVHVLLLKKLEQDPDPLPPPQFMAETGAGGEGAATAAVMAPERIGSLQVDPQQLDALISAELHSRDDAVLRLAAVARYLRQREPASPVPYLLLRAFRWGELRDAADGQVSQILEAPPAEIRAALRRHSQAGNWQVVLETAETAMCQSFGRGWLDIQRYAIRACDELGYKNASKALRAELKALLADMPDLPNLILQDDTGSANHHRSTRKAISPRAESLHMAREKGEGPVTLSVLDRVLDEEPKSSVEGPMTRSESLRRLKAAVRRDLEWLLNARQPVQPPPEGAAELEKSVYCFGLPDICSMNLVTVRNRSGLAQVMEAAIAYFEPRLIGPKVSLVTGESGSMPQLRFAIEGLLAVDPMPEHVRHGP